MAADSILSRALRAVAPTIALNRAKARNSLAKIDASTRAISNAADLQQAKVDRLRKMEGVRREQRQAANQLAMIAQRGYNIGKRHVNQIPFDFTSSRDPNVDIMEAVEEANSIVGHMIQNDPIAQDAAEMGVDFIIGEGLQPRCRSTKMKRSGGPNLQLRQKINAKVNASLEKHWENPKHFDYDGTMTYYEMIEVGLKAAMTRGDLMIIKVPRSREFCERRGLTMPYQCRLMDASWLNRHMTEYEGNKVVGGIEQSSEGGIEAFHFHEQQRADGVMGSSIRVPASAVIHWFRQDFPGQKRGITWFASSVNALINLEDNADAALERMKGETGMGVVLSVPFGMDPEDAMIGHADDYASSDFLTGGSSLTVDESTAAPEDIGLRSDGRPVDGFGRPVEYVEAGGVVRVRDGVKVEKLDPTPSGGFETFMNYSGRRVASGLGLMYEMLFNDWKNSNHSLARVSLEKVNVRNKRLRYRIIRAVCQPIYDLHIQSGIVARRWAEDDAARGIQDRWVTTDYWVPGEITSSEVSWIEPPKISPDEERDARARQWNMDSGETDLEEVLTRRGQDPYEVIRRRAEFAAWAKDECGYDVDACRSNKVGRSINNPDAIEDPDPQNEDTDQ